MSRQLKTQSGKQGSVREASFFRTHHPPRQRLGPRLRLVLVTTDSLLRSALQQVSTEVGRLWMLDCDGTVGEALNRIAGAVPDVILVDISPSERTGLEALSALHTALPAVPIVAVSASADRYDILRALLARADGYLVKPAKPAELAHVILGAHAGIGALGEQAEAALMVWMHGLGALVRKDSSHGLSCGERRFLACLSKQYSNRDIAHVLRIAYRTVDSMRTHVFGKLEVHRRGDAVRKFEELNG